jgi:NAD(P)H-dependent FMN reductase
MELETKLFDDVLVVATAPFMHSGPAVVLNATEWAPPEL